MNRITRFTTSSVGRKLIMGLSGLFLCSFLVVHLYVNLFLFKSDGGGTFDTYSEFMATYPLIRPLEIALFLGFLIHAAVGVWLWIGNRMARPARYEVNNRAENSTFSSRFSFVTGSIVLLFLLVHIYSFFIQSRFYPEGRTMYQIVATAFDSPLYDAFYLVALVILASHLKHGFQSAFQTLGMRNQRYRLLIEAVGVVFWLIIPAGFAAMPLYFLLMH